MHPPHAQGDRQLAFLQSATYGNQHRQVGHVQKNRRQQLEEAALAWIDPGQRHCQQGHDEYQDRQGDAPLQLGTFA
ncbi:hypothetical protein D3C79_880260 [compost metagenome]